MIIYYPEEEHDVKSLFMLLLKVYQSKKSACVLVINEVEQENLNSSLWKFRKFLPHGSILDEFSEDQPILISSKKLERKFDIEIYVQQDIKQENAILWNPPSKYSSEHKVWRQVNGKWEQI